MTAYADIEKAFVKYREDAGELRFRAFRIGGAITAALRERGKLPEGVLKLRPAGKLNYDQSTTYTVAGAMDYDVDDRAWKLGLELTVRRGQDIFPVDRLAIDVSIKQGEDKYNLSVPGVDVSFDWRDDRLVEAALNDFADGLLAEIVRHYSSARNAWLGADDKERLIGFNVK
jgi:hypothetical protein